MKLLPIAFIIVGLATLSGWSAASTKGNASLGETTAGLCVDCHQVDGSVKHNAQDESWPLMAGMDANYLAKQLRDYKSGERINAKMKPFADILSEQQIADVAQYYSELEPKPAQGEDNASEEVLKRGQILAELGDWSDYIVSCKSCHGPNNQGAGPVFPGIAGQYAGYAESQLKAWKDGNRKNDPQDLMGVIARRMSDDDIRAVAAWLATQPQSNSEDAQP